MIFLKSFANSVNNFLVFLTRMINCEEIDIYERCFYTVILFILTTLLYITNKISHCVRLIRKFIKQNILDFKNHTYTYFFGNENFKLSTPALFRKVIEKIKPESHILDFGCGNGICYLNQENISIIKKLNLRITGIDIDHHSVNLFKSRIQDYNLSQWINVLNSDIFETNFGSKFDYIILSESAPMLKIDLIIKLIMYAQINLLNPNGKIIFINNVLENPDRVMKFIKPKLKYFTCVDFGNCMGKQDFKYISEQTNTTVKFELLEEMTIKTISEFFKIVPIYKIFRLFGFTNYLISQYKITLE